jgi:hypothetical protein
MNYQSIRAKIEAPLLTAYNNQAPAIPVYFDNITFVPPDPPKEYVRVNLTFGMMSECALTDEFDFARGAIIIRCFAQKSNGPARCQQLLMIAKSVIDSINATGKTASSTYVRIKDISGPSFTSMEDNPHFMGKMEAGWQATVK